MNTMLITSGGLIVGGIGVLIACFWIAHTAPSYSDRDIACLIVGVVAGFAILAGFFIPVNTYVGRAYGRVECRNWGHQTGRPTKFVVYTSWDGGNCLTKDDHGKWISKDLVRQFGSGR